MDATRPLEFLGTTIAFSSVMTWLFNRSGESVPLVVLPHTGVSNFFSLVWSRVFPSLSMEDTTHAFLISSTAPGTRRGSSRWLRESATT